MPKHELFFILFSYLLGAIPFGYVLYYLTERKDIRKEGSGNIGATNVLRAKGRCAGITTLLLDALKGAVPVLYGLKHFDNPVIIMAGGSAVILGHLFSPYLKFKGGKGIATFLGVFAVFHFPSVLAFGAGFLATAYWTRYISAASISGVAAAFVVVLFTQVPEISMILMAVLLMILYKHRANIGRIAAGCEPRFKWSKKTNG